MKKKTFILIEAVLALLFIALAFVMFQGKTGKERGKISVIVQNSNDNQWAAFKYVLKMAAQDRGVEVFVVSTEGALTPEEEKSIIEREMENGADALIIQPAWSADTEKMLKNIQKRIPVMLVEHMPGKDREKSPFPAVKPDNYEMGKVLAEELLRDYNGKIEGKTVGIFAETEESEAVVSRAQGFRDVLKDTGASVNWFVSGIIPEDGENPLESQAKVDFVAALDDDSLTAAGACSAANNLHGALVYGIGNSTEAVYYLDTGFAECLVVPDEFNVGYESLTEIAGSIKKPLREIKSREVSYTVIRKDTLFSKENQEILFTMSQ